MPWWASSTGPSGAPASRYSSVRPSGRVSSRFVMGADPNGRGQRYPGPGAAEQRLPRRAGVLHGGHRQPALGRAPGVGARARADRDLAGRQPPPVDGELHGEVDRLLARGVDVGRPLAADVDAPHPEREAGGPEVRRAHGAAPAPAQGGRDRGGRGRGGRGAPRCVAVGAGELVAFAAVAVVSSSDPQPAIANSPATAAAAMPVRIGWDVMRASLLAAGLLLPSPDPSQAAYPGTLDG